MKRALISASAALVLAACSTTVTEKPGAGPVASGPLNVQSVTADAEGAVPGDVPNMLAEAVRIELAKSPEPAGQPARVAIHVTSYRMVGRGARFMVGALAGANNVKATVSVMSPDGRTVRQFDVSRSANTMGVGAFMNQQQALVHEEAAAIAGALTGRPTK